MASPAASFNTTSDPSVSETGSYVRADLRGLLPWRSFWFRGLRRGWRGSIRPHWPRLPPPLPHPLPFLFTARVYREAWQDSRVFFPQQYLVRLRPNILARTARPQCSLPPGGASCLAEPPLVMLWPTRGLSVCCQLGGSIQSPSAGLLMASAVPGGHRLGPWAHWRPQNTAQFFEERSAFYSLPGGRAWQDKTWVCSVTCQLWEQLLP